MRNPIRSETDAFYLACGTVGLSGGSVALGAAVDPIAGVALFAGGLLGAVIWEVSSQDPERRRPLREAAAAGQRSPHDQRHRVLVVANRTLAGTELRDLMRRHAEGGAQVRVVAPILVSRSHYIATDVDRELKEAHARLGATLAWAREHGIDATGKVGDPLTAFGAIEDELRAFAADEVVISTHPPGRSNWLEHGIVDRLREELDIPVEHIIVESRTAALATG